jgi:small subunit ribosomal protein S9
MAKDKGTWTVGRRKTSVARLKITDGSGKITINHKDVKDYIKTGDQKVGTIMNPISLVNVDNKYDYQINVTGGGINGQVHAIRHAISRALALKSSENRAILKKEGFLTRDSRMVERKKYGKRKARRGTQFSKR